MAARPTLSTTISTLPLLAMSPKAAPRRDFSGMSANPAAFETSSNVPLRRLRCSSMGSA